MQLYDRGIRRRLAPMLDGDQRRLRLAYSLMFTLPGTPVLRYGDELGMGDDLSLPERDCARTPMQWSTEPHGGFTKSDKPVRPGDQQRPVRLRARQRRQQRRDPESLLNWMERIIRMRKEVPEIGWGDFAFLHDARSGRARHALRLAQQLGALRSQPVGVAARSEIRDGSASRGGQAAGEPAHGRPQPRRLKMARH